METDAVQNENENNDQKVSILKSQNFLNQLFNELTHFLLLLKKDFAVKLLNVKPTNKRIYLRFVLLIREDAQYYIFEVNLHSR